MSKTQEEALTHFGIKGMRWGIQNDQSSSSNKNNGTVGVDPVTVAIAAYGTAVVVKAGMNTVDRTRHISFGKSFFSMKGGILWLTLEPD